MRVVDVTQAEARFAEPLGRVQAGEEEPLEDFAPYTA
jgi:antitoxin (DNA-binding transcriptional repressor) of toxin-antitoxin stability system